MQRDPARVQPDRLGGRRVLAVMAAEAEVGAALRARSTPLLSGVGPVEGASRPASRCRRWRPARGCPTSCSASARPDPADWNRGGSIKPPQYPGATLTPRHSVSPRESHPSSRPGPRDRPARADPRPARGAALTGADMAGSGRPMTRSTPTWSTWKPSRCCAPASGSACRSIGLRGIWTGPRRCATTTTGPSFCPSRRPSCRGRGQPRRPARGRLEAINGGMTHCAALPV